MRPGLYDGISNAEYHGGAGVSKSLLDLIARSPAHMKAALDRPQEERKPTPAQAIGTAFHALVLEPKLFASEYTLAMRRTDFPEAVDDKELLVAMVSALNAKRLPKLATTGSKSDQVERILAAQDGWNRDALDEMKGAELKQIIDKLNQEREGLLSVSGSTEQLAETLRANGQPVTLWRDLKAEWERNNGHRAILAPDDWDTLHAMRESVLNHPKASALLAKPGKAEQSIYWNDAATGALCRCRPDYLTDDGYIVDLKTTEDASPEEFAKSVANYRYHVQHPFYMDGATAIGIRPRAFVFIAVEKKAPYAVGVYVLDAAAVELGRMQYGRDLAVYAECLNAGIYPAYSERIESLALPGWYLNQKAQQIAA